MTEFDFDNEMGHELYFEVTEGDEITIEFNDMEETVTVKDKSGDDATTGSTAELVVVPENDSPFQVCSKIVSQSSGSITYHPYVRKNGERYELQYLET